MSVVVLVCGNVLDGISDTLTGPAEILVEDNRIAKVERSVGRPPGPRVIDHSERTVSPGFIDTMSTLRWMPRTSRCKRSNLPLPRRSMA